MAVCRPPCKIPNHRRPPASLRWIACLAAAAATLQGGTLRYSFREYGPGQGLANVATGAIVQDTRHYIWVGTQSGLYRYDGTSFRQIGELGVLASLDIAALAAGPNGEVWIGSSRSISIARGEQIETIDVGQDFPITYNGSFSLDRQGRLYAASSVGLVRVDGSSPGHPSIQWISQAPSFGVHVDAAGIVWFGCATDLCRYDGRQVEQVGASAGLPRDNWDSMISDLAGDLWVRSVRRLYVLRHGAGKAERQDQDLPFSTPTASTLGILPHGELAVPTDDGLMIIHDGKRQMIGRESGLAGEAVAATLVDHENSVWLAVRGAGVQRWLGYRKWEAWTRTGGLPNDTIWAVRRDSTGGLWVGSSGGVSLLKAGASDWITIGPKQGFPGSRVRAIAASREGGVWVGASPGRLVRLSADGRILASYGEESGISDPLIQGIVEEPGGTVWVASAGGLFRGVRTATWRFEKMKPPGERSGHKYYQGVLDELGRFWTPSYQGLLGWDHGAWRLITKADGLRDNHLLAVAYGKGCWWVGYAEPLGVSRVCESGGKLRIDHFDASNGMKSQKVYSLGVDRSDRLWVGADAGVDLYDQGVWSHFGQATGLIWEDCDTNGILADSDGSVWIGTSRGLAHHIESPHPRKPIRLQPILTKVLLGGGGVPGIPPGRPTFPTGMVR